MDVINKMQHQLGQQHLFLILYRYKKLLLSHQTIRVQKPTIEPPYLKYTPTPLVVPIIKPMLSKANNEHTKRQPTNTMV